MKITLIKPYYSIFSLTLIVLLWTSCGKKDLETLDPYDYQSKKFEAVTDIPVVEDPDPEVIEPNIGGIENSPLTLAAITNLETANSEAEINAQTSSNLDLVFNFSDGLSAEFKSAANSIDAAGLERILDLDQELDEAYDELISALDQAPEEVLAVLPSMTLGEGAGEGNRLKMVGGSTEGIWEELSNFRITALTDACSDAANQAYDNKIMSLDHQRDSVIAVLDENYGRRVREADERFTTRLSLFDTHYESQEEELRNVVNRLFGLINKMDGFSVVLGQTMRYYAVMYAVQGRLILQVYGDQVMELLEESRDQEKATVLGLYEMRTEELAGYYEERINQSNEILERSLKTCHDQGGGN
ncbi:hypothetical protein IFO69_14940 [Echinicola sp. CAU 1574]|uniref:Uncharacterized protein n=1 Tax=Echinicola arenosa TaxID=2774144 RepID=A0ABR9AMM5_9BACT|nr:hypothetical protein [Echinicola arenosa]MBD8490051.1 hypothetical protein [Echinicola arenosa]